MKILIAAVSASLAVLGQASSVFACGGLVAPNGTVHLGRATTFVAYHQGVEHYVTSFSYSGNVSNLGWIVPLPAVPTSIKEAGAWTLQRLELEVTPPAPRPLFCCAAEDAASGAQVLQRVQVDALNITVIKGSGDEVLTWCRQNGFALPSDTADHLLRYAKASPIFMAAKYDTSRSQTRRLFGGDGTPVLITMNVTHPWVPLEVLANDGDQVLADLFMLTDKPLVTGAEDLVYPTAEGHDLPGATGFRVAKQEPMNERLHRDLASDRNMGWVPDSGYLTYLQLNAPASTVDYDLTVNDASAIKLVSYGTPPNVAATATEAARFSGNGWLISVIELFLLVAGVAGVIAALIAADRRQADRTTPASTM